MTTREYRGCSIDRAFPSGYWRTSVWVRDACGAYYVPLLADTLEGMREAIRETLRAHGMLKPSA